MFIAISMSNNWWFQCNVKEVSWHLFSIQYKLKSLNKDLTCYKNIDKLSCIDLLPTNSAKRLQITYAIEIGLLNFIKLVVTVLNEKLEPISLEVIQYKDYKKFNSAIFNNNRRKQNENFNLNELDFTTIRKNFMKIFDKFTTLKKKYIIANHSRFVTEERSKVIMLTSKLRCQFLKTKTQEPKMKYNKQIDLCACITRKV